MTKINIALNKKDLDIIGVSLLMNIKINYDYISHSNQIISARDFEKAIKEINDINKVLVKISKKLRSSNGNN